MKRNYINLKKIMNIILIFVCLISIFVFSNMSGKKSNLSSKRLLENILKITEIQREDSTQEFVEEYHELFRKIIHAIEYMILALCLMSFFSCYNTRVLEKFIIVLVICIICSIFDEFHQYFVDSRTASIVDCLIDNVGTLIGIGVHMLIYSIYCVIFEVVKVKKEKRYI